MRRVSVILALLALIILFGAPAWAGQEIGVVIGLEGSVTARNDQGERTLHLKSPVFVQDTVLTGPDGKVQILFNDETVLAQGPDSEITLRDYGFDQDDPGGSKFLMSFSRGAFRMITGKIAKDNPEQFNVQSPLATIGIRGTDFGGERDPLTNEEYWAAFHLDAGHRVVITHRGSGQSQDILGDLQGVGVNAEGLGGVMNMPEERRRRFMGQTQISGRGGGGSGGGAGPGGDNGGPGTGPGDGSGDEPPVGLPLLADGGLGDGLGLVPGVDEVGDTVNDIVGDTLPDGAADGGDDGGGLVFDGSFGGYVIDHMISSAILRTGAAGGPLEPVIEPYYMSGMQFIDDPYKLWRAGYGGGTGDYIELAFDDVQTILWLGSVLEDLPAAAPFVPMGEYADAQGDIYMKWGFWDSKTVFALGGADEFRLDNVYDVRGDVNDQLDPALSGTYSGSAEGSYYLGGVVYASGTGDFSCIVDIDAGTVSALNIEVVFNTGDAYNTFQAMGGEGSITGGQFDIVNWGFIQTPKLETPNHIYAAGALFGPDAVGGVWNFQNSGAYQEAGVGVFHGLHD